MLPISVCNFQQYVAFWSVSGIVLNTSVRILDKKPSCRQDSRPYCLTPPLRDTWRNQSRDHLIVHMPFPIGGPLEQSLNQAVFEILRSKRIVVTNLTFQGHVASSVTWPFDSLLCHFLLVVVWNQASISNGFRNIHCRMSRNDTWHTTSKRRSRSFILYQSISRIQLPIGSQ